MDTEDSSTPRDGIDASRKRRLESRAAWRDRNRDKIRAAARKYASERLARETPDDRERRLEYARAYFRKQSAPFYNRHHKRRGIPEPTRPYPGTCECCGGGPNGKGRLHLDHCHETGAFRGWLCYNCNVGIGNLGDNTAGLQRAIDYLEGVKGSTVAKATGREFDLATSTIHWH